MRTYKCNCERRKSEAGLRLGIFRLVCWAAGVESAAFFYGGYLND